MSDQTPPAEAAPAGGLPPPPAPPLAPAAPPVPPHAGPGPADAPYPGPPHPAPAYPNPPYPGGAYPNPNPPYPGGHYPNPPYPGGHYPNPPYPGAPAPNFGYYPGAYSPAAYPAASLPAAPGPAAKKPGGLGLVALLLSLAAAVVAPIVGAIAAFPVGTGAWSHIETLPADALPDLSFLSPVREWVLLAEIAFWAGTVLGVWAIVQGIVATVKGRGRGAGIAAIVVASVAPFIFGTVVYAAAIAGIATGAGIGA